MAEQKGCHGNDNENGATATITKMVPRQHIRKWCHDNISVPVAHGDTDAREKCADECVMQKVVG